MGDQRSGSDAFGERNNHAGGNCLECILFGHPSQLHQSAQIVAHLGMGSGRGSIRNPFSRRERFATGALVPRDSDLIVHHECDVFRGWTLVEIAGGAEIRLVGDSGNAGSHRFSLVAWCQSVERKGLLEQ